MRDFLNEFLELDEKNILIVTKQWKLAVIAGQSSQEFWKNYLAQKGKELPDDLMLKLEQASVFEEIPGVLDIVKNLHEQGYQTPLFSNVMEWHANVLRREGYYQFFDPLFLSYEMGVIKPQPQAYQMLLCGLNIPASAVIMVDDREENVLAAREQGIDAIVFKDAKQLKDELEKREIRITANLE